eukprot:scaffold1.g5812.t1
MANAVALHKALARGAAAAADGQLISGAVVDHALHLACAFCLAAAPPLIQRDANVDAVLSANASGIKTGVERLEKPKSAEAWALLNALLPCTCLLALTARVGHATATDVLLAAGASVAWRGEGSGTLLHTLPYGGDTPATVSIHHALVERGADWNPSCWRCVLARRT